MIYLLQTKYSVDLVIHLIGLSGVRDSLGGLQNIGNKM